MKEEGWIWRSTRNWRNVWKKSWWYQGIRIKCWKMKRLLKLSGQGRFFTSSFKFRRRCSWKK